MTRSSSRATRRREPAAAPARGGDASFGDAVIGVIASIPPGHVMTYGEVAAEAGFPGAARAVGNLLRTTPGLPWWRVVTVAGRLVPDHESEHAQRLRAEGVTVKRGRVLPHRRGDHHPSQ